MTNSNTITVRLTIQDIMDNMLGLLFAKVGQTNALSPKIQIITWQHDSRNHIRDAGSSSAMQY
jgi:hypothetical protein